MFNLFGNKSEKKPCACCGKPLGLLAGDLHLADGEICCDCWAKAGFQNVVAVQSTSNQYTLAQIRERIEAREAERRELEKFRATKTIGPLAVDESLGAVRVSVPGQKMHTFFVRKILDFELLEDGESLVKSKGGIGRAIVGGMIFGGAGAIVGAVTGGKRSKKVCTSMKIKITLRDYDVDALYIDLITKETKCNSIVYKNAAKQAQDILSALQVAADKAQAEAEAEAEAEAHSASGVAVSSGSALDEIAKLKNLLDAGAITQEEFDAKKKQLLNL